MSLDLRKERYPRPNYFKSFSDTVNVDIQESYNIFFDQNMKAGAVIALMTYVILFLQHLPCHARKKYVQTSAQTVVA